MFRSPRDIARELQELFRIQKLMHGQQRLRAFASLVKIIKWIVLEDVLKAVLGLSISRVIVSCCSGGMSISSHPR